jgi:hypothetical protein
VQTVTAARHQNEEVSVVMLDPDETVERRFPAPHIDSGAPEVIAIGGITNGSVTDAAGPIVGTPAESDYGIRAFVLPVPDDDYIINYSYRVKPTALSAVTDTFSGVPESAIDRIVDDATSEMMLMVPTSDAALGELNRRSSLRKRDKQTSLHRPDKGRRFAIRPSDLLLWMGDDGNGHRYRYLERPHGSDRGHQSRRCG